MQDSAPSHSAKATQNFLRDNTPDFISSQQWTPHSPDLNPLDYSVWHILQEVYKGRREPFTNLKDLQNVIRHKWHDVDDHTVRKAILQWKRRLAAVAKQNGGPIQHIFCWSVDWYELLWCSDVACVQPTTYYGFIIQHLMMIVMWHVALTACVLDTDFRRPCLCI